MKKFWNLMLAALVIIGATACTENYENIENAESFSFYAEIGDDTRATIEKDGDVWKTTFEGGEILMVNGYKFTNTKMMLYFLAHHFCISIIINIFEITLSYLFNNFFIFL